jgi:predicted Zn-dependent protease
MSRHFLFWCCLLPLAGCEFVPSPGPGGPGGGGNPGAGPGHRPQTLALSPAQELSLGKQAFAEVLQEYRGRVVPEGHPQARRIVELGKRIQKAAGIQPLRREINLRIDDRYLEWEFVLLEDKQANAFCLPGGKVAVFTGLLPVAENDDQLAAVVGHEVAHALAHHSSERLARRQMLQKAAESVNGALGSIDEGSRRQIVGLLGAGGSFSDLHYERQQESEADHIGIFLMTFAGYDPRQAEVFWQNMGRRSGGGAIPEIFSDHPSDARRVAQIRQWRNYATAALAAWKAGNVVHD